MRTHIRTHIVCLRAGSKLRIVCVSCRGFFRIPLQQRTGYLLPARASQQRRAGGGSLVAQGSAQQGFGSQGVASILLSDCPPHSFGQLQLAGRAPLLPSPRNVSRDVFDFKCLGLRHLDDTEYNFGDSKGTRDHPGDEIRARIKSQGFVVGFDGAVVDSLYAGGAGEFPVSMREGCYSRAMMQWLLFT